MKKLILLLAMSFLTLANTPCPQIDKSKVDVDGMPFCPDVVKQTSAYAVYRCPLDITTSFHTPTQAEMGFMRQLVSAYQQVTVGGIKLETTHALLSAADSLNLQACRVSQDRPDGKDSFLLVYTKAGVRDYSGPFLMLRETRHSKVMIIGPHDDTDGTFEDTKLGLQDTQAMAVISNGHRRGKTAKNGGRGDFVHETDNLATYAVSLFGEAFSNHVWLHIHGMKDYQHVLYRSRSPVFSKAFEAAVVKETYIKPDAFAPLNAGFTVDSLVNTGFYLKTEMPVRIHQNNPHAVANIVKQIETYAWAW